MVDVLSQLVGDGPLFVSSYWAQHPLLHRGVAEGVWRDLLTLQNVDHLLSSARSEVHLLAGNEWIDRASYTRAVDAAPMRPAGLVVDPGKVYAQFCDRATAVLLGLHEWWPPLARFCNELSRGLTLPVQANAYVTAPRRIGSRHHDNHDVIVLQIHGTKNWTVWAGPIEEMGEVEVEATLSPGDCLYVPRRRAHAVSTDDHLSIHITFGVAAPTWGAALIHILKERLPRELLERTLPAGFAGSDARGLRTSAAGVLDELRSSLARFDLDDVAQLISAEYGWQPVPSWDGQLTSLVACESLNPASRVRRRSDVPCNVVVADDLLRLDLADRSLEMPRDLIGAISLVTGDDAFDVSDLAEHLDLDSALVLVRRLIREGLLQVETDSR